MSPTKKTIKQGNYRLCYIETKPDQSPVKKFMDLIPDEQKNRFDRMFDRICDQGKISNQDHFKKVGEFRHCGKRTPIFEFKGWMYRLFCIPSGNEWIIVHGYVKKERRCDPKEIEKVKNIIKANKEILDD